MTNNRLYAATLSAAVSIAALFSLSGCATSVGAARKPIQSIEEIESSAGKQFAAMPAIQKVKVPFSAFIVKSKAGSLPVGKDRDIEASFNDATIAHVLQTISLASGLNCFYADVPTLVMKASTDTTPAPDYVLAPSTPTSSTSSAATNGYSVMNATGSTSSSTATTIPAAGGSGTTTNATQVDVAEKAAPKTDNISLTFNGKISDLLTAISRSTGWIFSYEGGAIYMKRAETYNVVVPGYEDLLGEIKRNVSMLGGTNIAYDHLTSTMTFQADYNAAERISEFCRKARDNAALVTMRIMLVNVALNGTANAGIDWTGFNFGYGTQKVITGFGNRTDGGSSSNSSSSSGSTSASGGASSSSASVSGSSFINVVNEVANMTTGVGVIGNPTGAGVFIEAAKFTLGSVLNYIETYGRFEVMQNSFIMGLSGTKNGLSSVTQTPYVQQLLLTALSTNATSATQGVQTATAQSGIVLEVIPSYNKLDGTLYMPLKVMVSNINRMVTLSAGNQVGTFTQPEITYKSINAFLRMTPSQVAVIGGLTTSSKVDSSSGLPGDTLLTKTASTTTSNEQLVVIVKPAVIEFEPET